MWSTGVTGQICNTTCTFVLQGDGNLVLYNNGNHLSPSSFLLLSTLPLPSFPRFYLFILLFQTPLWSTGVTGQMCNTTCTFVLQGDGNLVLYNNGNPVFSSGSFGPNEILQFNSFSPYLVLFDNTSDVVWSSSYIFPKGKLP
jgi:hypothetical protein